MYIYAYACLYIYVSIPAWRPGTRAIGGTWGLGCGGNWQRRSPSVSELVVFENLKPKA